MSQTTLTSREEEEYWRAFIYHMAAMRAGFFSRSAPPGSSLSLSIEVDSSHRNAKFILFSKPARIEMIPKRWNNYSLPALLLEKHKNESVDTNAGLWALIAYDFPSCNSNGRQMYTRKNKCIQSMERTSTGEGEDLPKEASVVPGGRHCRRGGLLISKLLWQHTMEKNKGIRRRAALLPPLDLCLSTLSSAEMPLH